MTNSQNFVSSVDLAAARRDRDAATNPKLFRSWQFAVAMVDAAAAKQDHPLATQIVRVAGRLSN